MLNTLQALELAYRMFLSYLLTHENLNVPYKLLDLNLPIIQRIMHQAVVRNMLSEDWSVLNMGSTTSVPNIPSFLELLKAFLKRAIVISLNFKPYYRSNA